MYFARLALTDLARSTPPKPCSGVFSSIHASIVSCRRLIHSKCWSSRMLLLSPKFPAQSTTSSLWMRRAGCVTLFPKHVSSLSEHGARLTQSLAAIAAGVCMGPRVRLRDGGSKPFTSSTSIARGSAGVCEANGCCQPRNKIVAWLSLREGRYLHILFFLSRAPRAFLNTVACSCRQSGSGRMRPRLLPFARVV